MSNIGETHAENSAKKVRRGNPDKIKPFAFRPGRSGNPGGRPKRDMAAKIAQQLFEENPELIYEAMGKALLKGNPKVFTALSDRAYGRPAQNVNVSQTEPTKFVFKIEHIEG